MSRCAPMRVLRRIVLLLLAALPAGGEAGPHVVIRRVSEPPALEDFLGMKPKPELEAQLTRVEGFVQRLPRDGAPSTQRTVVYLGYDDHRLYAVFLCFDDRPDQLRARLVNREQFQEDDEVAIELDTFHDQRRAYAFAVNPFGVQWDAIWTEGQGWDMSFDALWYSKAARTSAGYVAWMALPFKSLRFPATREQTWGLLLNRDVRRLGEESFWPPYSLRVEGRLNQMAVLTGLEDISPGRNIQFIPYVSFRSFRALDLREPAAPRFAAQRADPDAGLDTKLILKDSLVLDVTLNPDFSQVESDEPQITVNQRFEVFFPEKRPFFMENAGYFQTPLNLTFTRRIGEPQWGARLTGKIGPYSIGAFLTDDEAPGKRVPDDHSLSGQRAYAGVLRLSRDILRQSSIGLIYAERHFGSAGNRVAGVDVRFKLNENWTAAGQAATSRSRSKDSRWATGPAYQFRLARAGRSLKYALDAGDRSPGFRADLGFVPRTDIRSVAQLMDYCFRPQVRGLVCVGPGGRTEIAYDHKGTRLELSRAVWFGVDLIRQTSLSVSYNADREQLRPQDFPVLAGNHDFARKRLDVLFKTSWFDWLTLDSAFSWGYRANFAPPPGREPFLTSHRYARLEATLRPVMHLSIRNSYLFTALGDPVSGAGVFNNHIIRTKWNYQFTRELSARVILQYNTILTNPALTALEKTKNFNADLLISYLLHPGMAVFVGYNTNLENIDPALRVQPCPLSDFCIGRTRHRFTNDGRQFFVKLSYLFRF